MSLSIPPAVQVMIYLYPLTSLWKYLFYVMIELRATLDANVLQPWLVKSVQPLVPRVASGFQAGKSRERCAAWERIPFSSMLRVLMIFAYERSDQPLWSETGSLIYSVSRQQAVIPFGRTLGGLRYILRCLFHAFGWTTTRLCCQSPRYRNRC